MRETKRRKKVGEGEFKESEEKRGKEARMKREEEGSSEGWSNGKR